MVVRNTFYLFLGLVLGLSFALILNTSYAQFSDIIQEQVYAEKYTGSYQPVYETDFQVFTYETLCKGFYIITDDGVEKTVTGYGDLAELYTYTQPTEKVDLSLVKASTTNETLDIIPVFDTPVL